MNPQQQFENVEDMFKEAEETFRKGIGTLSTWSEQARDLIENRPGVILAAVGVSGFITGSLLRHGFMTRRSARSGETPGSSRTLPGFANRGLPADPLVLFGAGVLAGVVAGPKIIQEALSGLDRFSHGDNVMSFESHRRGEAPHPEGAHATPMDERPFEKA